MPQWALHALVMLAIFLFILGIFLIVIGLSGVFHVTNPSRTAAFAFFVLVILQGLGVLLPTISSENLQASFQIASDVQNITVTSSITNNGQKTDKISGVGLFLIQTHSDKRDDPSDYLNVCDTANTLVIITQQFLPGFGLGGDKQLINFFSPSKLVIDGKEWSGQNPLAIGPSSNKEIEALFSIPTIDFVKYDTAVLCPMLAVLDEHGTRKMAVCRGTATVLTGKMSGIGTSTATFQILPRRIGETACEAVS